MIVSEIMTTKLITVKTDDTLSHAANLLRQYQFHHLPVVRAIYAKETPPWGRSSATARLLLQGLLTSQDIDLAMALDEQSMAGDMLHQPWQERRVADVMHPAPICVTPTTSVAAAAQLLVERGLNCLPVAVNEETDQEEQRLEEATRPLLVGLLTRSDLLMALARSLGAFEPGTDMILTLNGGDLRPLAQALLLASELHIPVRSVLAVPLEGGAPRVATLRLGTIHPTPMYLRLQEAQIHYLVGEPMLEGKNDV